MDETSEGLDISVDTTSTGTLRGIVELKGPAGMAEIAIEIELLPQTAQTSPTRRSSRSAGERVLAHTTPADQPKGGPAPSTAQPPTPKDLANEEPTIANSDFPERSDGRHAAIQEGTGIPAMPVIAPSEEFADTPHPLVDGLSPTIGWQFRPQRKGGPAFTIIRRSALGSLKIVETFPLTEDGWAGAWQSLIQQNPAAVPKALATLRARKAAAQQG